MGTGSGASRALVAARFADMARANARARTQALLRPGRFDRLLYVTPPASASERLDILRLLLRSVPLQEDVVREGLATLARDKTCVARRCQQRHMHACACLNAGA